MSDLQRARALLYGLALGDSLGWPIEFLKMDKITIIYGSEGIQEPPDPAIITDDTQTSIVVAESLIEADEQDIDTIMSAFTRRMIAWSNSPDNDRAPGHTVTEAIRTLEAGVTWRESGIPHAKGNGSAIRVAPIGFLYQHDPERLREVARATSMATHMHPTAIVSSIAIAYIVKLALDGVHPVDYIEKTLAFLGDDATEEFVLAVNKIDRVDQWKDERAAIEHLGSGWIAEEAVAMAVYCAIRHFDDYPAAIRRAVNIPGASDSVGSITGGVVAARLGLGGIPADWLERVENKDVLLDVAQQLTDKKQYLYDSKA